MNILTTIINNLDGADWSPFILLLKKLFYDILWIFIGGTLCVIKAIERVINYVGVDIVFDLLLNGKQEKFDGVNIPVQFWCFLGIAIFMIIFVFVFQYISICLTCEDLTFKERLVQTLKMSGYASLFIIVIPIIFIVFLIMSKLFFQACMSALGKKDIGLADMLYDIGADINKFKEPKVHSYDELLKPPENYHNHNIVVKIIATGVVAYGMVMLGLGMVSKAFELLFLFVISPLIGARMPSDQGQSIKVWKEMVIAKMLANIGAIMGYMLFTIFYSSIVLMLEKKGDFIAIEKYCLMMLLTIGGAVFILLVPQMLSEFIGEQVGAREGRNAILGTRHALGTIRTGLGLLGVTTLFSKKINNKNSISGGGTFSQRGGVIGATGRARKAAGNAIKQTLKDPKQAFKSTTQFIGKSALRMGAVSMVSATGGLSTIGKTAATAAVIGGTFTGKALFKKYKDKKQEKQKNKNLTSANLTEQKSESKSKTPKANSTQTIDSSSK